MIKKMVLFLSILLCFGTSCAFAQSEAQIGDLVYSGNEITVKIAAQKNVRLRITVSRADVGETAENVYWLSEKTAEADGSALFVFIMPDVKNGSDTSGEYRILVRADGGEICEKRFSFVSKPERENVLSTVNAMNAQTAPGELLQMFEIGSGSRNAFVCMGTPVSLLEGLSTQAKEKSLKKLLEMKDGDFTEETFNVAYIKSVGIEAINGGTADKTEEIVYLLNPQYGGKGFSEIADEKLKKWVCEIVGENKPYENAAAFESTYKMANILYEFNNARYSTLERLFASNASEIGISGTALYQSYCSMETNRKTAVNEYIVRALAASPARTYAAVSQALKAGIENGSSLPSGGNTGGNIGGGGGNGGGGGGFAGSGETKNVGSVGAPSNAQTVFQSAKYSDIENVSWAIRAIEALTDAGIVSGTGGGKFEPERIVTREEFVKMVVLAVGLKDENQNLNFSDVKKGSWAESFIKIAVKAGIITGESEGVFGVGKPLSRQDMAVIACRAGRGNQAAKREKMEFSDSGEISDYAKSSVETLYMAELINGFENNTFRPFELCTRAMAAQVIYNMFLK